MTAGKAELARPRPCDEPTVGSPEWLVWCPPPSRRAALWALGLSYYCYLTFLGYSALPFLERTEVGGATRARAGGWPQRRQPAWLPGCLLAGGRCSTTCSSQPCMKPLNACWRQRGGLSVNTSLYPLAACPAPAALPVSDSAHRGGGAAGDTCRLQSHTGSAAVLVRLQIASTGFPASWRQSVRAGATVGGQKQPWAAG